MATQIFRSILLQEDERGLFTNEESGLPANAVIAKPLAREAEALLATVSLNDIDQIVLSTRRIFPLHHFDGREAGNCFHVFHAMLRIAALLHDAGHMPFSHIFEFAVLRLVKEDFKWSGNDNKVKKEKADFVSLVKSEEPGKLHELFGRKLMMVIAETLIPSKADSVGYVNASDAFRRLIFGAIEILHTEKYPIAQSIISGFTDADRIDFIRRDTQLSGLLKSSVDYERLFNRLYSA